MSLPPPANSATIAPVVVIVPANSGASVSPSTVSSASAHSAAASASIAAPSSPPCTRLLSIQSSVVYGYVGNKASNFPLQLLGFDVDPIHSCQLSNHTGHKSFSGYKTTGADCASITRGLKENQFIQQYNYLLTGYMSNIDFFQQAVELIKEMKQKKPDLIFGQWACDPVMGDNGSLYVPASFVPIYRDSLLSLSDIVTPNQTEAELLSEIKIVDMASAYQNLVWFHQRGVKIVIITSMTLPSTSTSDDSTSNGNTQQQQSIDLIASCVTDLSSPAPHQYAHMRIPRVPTYFSGTGDLTTALLLAWLVKTQQQATPATSASFTFAQLVRSLELTMATLQSVIHRTAQAQSEELLLIQSKRDIEEPNIKLRATIVDAKEMATK